MFRDRNDAGRQLAEKLAKYSGQNAAVLALPLSPEYAIGAVDDSGAIILNDAETESVSQAWLSDEIEREKKEAERRVTADRGDRPPVTISGRIALIVDDGIATGLTVRLAVRSLRAQNPARIVVAVPVASAEAVESLRKEAGQIIALEPPEEFLGAVGSHYLEFAQVEDAEVKKLLSEV